MKKIIVLAGSNSKNSINKQLATYTAGLLTKEAELKILDLNDYLMPIYSVDEESEKGVPETAKKLIETIHTSDGIILSLAEHNGNFTAAFKNVYDWMSRIQQKLWNDIPMLLMATSPGGRGGASVLGIAKTGFPYMGGNIISSFSLPSFGQNFIENKIVNQELKSELEVVVKQFEEVI
ncbi:chromate reductase, NAD(P)H dehydrogenase (quinone) [Tenacibaculum sp. 190524A02b]|uniref:Chromate reductase, NAD(P)H dehydrogenase (Quinone) n=1 Tax=Tenacibaculum vairaonense TaxID=3137860 RepID=A0ABP1FBP2_9FLAO